MMGKKRKRHKGYSDEEFDEETEEFAEDAGEEEIEDDEDTGDDGDDEDYEDDGDEDDEDYEDDGDEDDEDYEDDEDDEWDEDDRRAYRHRRRVRNQIIVYGVIFFLSIGIVAGSFMAGRKVVSVIHRRQQAAEEAKRLEEEKKAAEEEAEEELLIDTPEPAEEEPEEEEDILGELAASYYSEMSVEDKVAGLFIVTPEALTGVRTATKAGEGTQEALKQYAVGGMIYFGQNILDQEQITEMLANTASMSNYPMFLAVDEEGGEVSRVANSKVEVAEVEDMATVGASGDVSQAQEAGTTIGSYLKELGFNVDFAPVADVVAEDGESALGNRAFGSDPQLVGEMAAGVVEGIEGAGVSACLKHFPGLGSAAEDTHDGRVEINKTADELRDVDFQPFSAGIEAGADFVMVSHASVPALDEDNVPSSLSKKVITDTLRGELGFEGIVITDALDMAAITEYYTPEEAAVMAVEAGADMLLMPNDFEKAYNAVLEAVKDGTISEERIDESLDRIYRVKCAEKLEQ